MNPMVLTPVRCFAVLLDFCIRAYFAISPLFPYVLFVAGSFSITDANPFLREQCALTWDALCRGRPPTISSCALATDPSTIPPVPSCADPPPFHSPWPTATSTKPPERSSSPPGPKPISAQEKRGGGTRERFF